MIRKPNAIVSIRKGVADVSVGTANTVVEVRDYDIQALGDDRSRLWTDEQGETCERYFATADGENDYARSIAKDLERFAADLKQYSGIEATLKTDSSSDGLHVLTINKVDYYFNADGSGYDGWGKYMDDGA